MKRILLGGLVASGLVLAGCERQQEEVMEERYEQEGTGGASEEGSDLQQQQQREQRAQEQDEQLEQYQQSEQQQED